MFFQVLYVLYAFVIIAMILALILTWILPIIISSELSRKLNASVEIERFGIKLDFSGLLRNVVTFEAHDVSITYVVQEDVIRKTTTIEEDDSENWSGIFDHRYFRSLAEFLIFAQFRAIHIYNISVFIVFKSNKETRQNKKNVCLYATADELQLGWSFAQYVQTPTVNIKLPEVSARLFDVCVDLTNVDARIKYKSLLAKLSFGFTMDATLQLQRPPTFEIWNYPKEDFSKYVSTIRTDVQNLAGKISTKFENNDCESSFSVGQIFCNYDQLCAGYIRKHSGSLLVQRFGWSFDDITRNSLISEDTHVLGSPLYMHRMSIGYELDVWGDALLNAKVTGLHVEMSNRFAENITLALRVFNEFDSRRWAGNIYPQKHNRVDVTISVHKFNCFVKVKEQIWCNEYMVLRCDDIQMDQLHSTLAKVYPINMHQSKVYVVNIKTYNTNYKCQNSSHIQDYKLYAEMVRIAIHKNRQQRHIHVNLLNKTHIKWCPSLDFELLNLGPDIRKFMNIFTQKHITRKAGSHYKFNIHGNFNVDIKVSQSYTLKLTFDEASKQFICQIMEKHFNNIIPLSRLRYFITGENNGVKLSIAQIRWTYLSLSVELCRPLPATNKIDGSIMVSFDTLMKGDSGIMIAFNLLGLIVSPSMETWRSFRDSFFRFFEHLFLPPRAIKY